MRIGRLIGWASMVGALATVGACAISFPDYPEGSGGAGGSPGPTCANVDWACWPMPNGGVDVADGAPNPMGYTNNGDGTVTDTVTGLMWEAKAELDYTSYTWANAKARCSTTLSTLALGGHHDWRLPSYIELVSLVDYGIAGAPSINAAFPNTNPSQFWSATPLAGAPSNAWIVHFGHGATYCGAMADENQVRCVR